MPFEPSTVRQVREDGEYYIPDRLSDEEDEPAAALTEAASAYTAKVRDAQGLLDDAINLVGVLLDALEQDADTRAAQSRTVLEMSSSVSTRRTPSSMSRRVRIRICSWRISRGRKRKGRKPGRRWMGKPFANAVAVGEAAAAFPQRHFLATWADSRLLHSSRYP